MPKFEPEATHRDWAVILFARKYAQAYDAMLRGDPRGEAMSNEHATLCAHEDLLIAIRQAYSAVE